MATELQNSSASEMSFFIRQCDSFGIHLSDGQVRQFLTFYEMMIEKNKVMNLTSITQLDEVVRKHYLDSLLVIKEISIKDTQSILDLGTGAGFPGIPLKIVFPEIHITLADSLNKRILFLNEVIRELGLIHIDTVHGRAEDLGRNPKFREKYDLVLSRAVANLSTLSEYCLPFVKKDGMFVSYKSSEIEDEFQQSQKAIRVLGGSCEGLVKDCIPGTELERSFVIVRKVKNTPAKYPRKAGMPGKEPII